MFSSIIILSKQKNREHLMYLSLNQKSKHEVRFFRTTKNFIK